MWGCAIPDICMQKNNLCYINTHLLNHTFTACTQIWFPATVQHPKMKVSIFLSGDKRIFPSFFDGRTDINTINTIKTNSVY